MVRALVENNFVVHQVEAGTEEGARAVAAYNLDALPAMLVLDPVTGALFRHWTGFVSAER